MKVIEPGRVCVKKAGREAGKVCVIVEVLDDNFVVIDGPEVKRRRCNIAHLEPLPYVIEVKENMGKEQIAKALQEAGVELGLRKGT